MNSLVSTLVIENHLNLVTHLGIKRIQDLLKRDNSIFLVTERNCDALQLNRYFGSDRKIEILSAENLFLQHFGATAISQQDQFDLMQYYFLTSGYCESDITELTKELWPFFNMIWPKDVSFLQVLMGPKRKKLLSTASPEWAIRMVLAVFQCVGQAVSNLPRVQDIQYLAALGLAMRGKTLVWWHAPTIDDWTLNEPYSDIQWDPTWSQIFLENFCELHDENSVSSLGTLLQVKTDLKAHSSHSCHAVIAENPENFWNSSPIGKVTCGLNLDNWQTPNGGGCFPITKPLLQGFVGGNLGGSKWELSAEAAMQSIEVKLKRMQQLATQSLQQSKIIFKEYGIPIQSKGFLETLCAKASYCVDLAVPMFHHASEFRFEPTTCYIGSLFPPSVPLSAPRRLLRNILPEQRLVSNLAKHKALLKHEEKVTWIFESELEKKHHADIWHSETLTEKKTKPAAVQSPYSQHLWPEWKLTSSLGVTAFEKYLQCPFQFYLSEVCKLAPSDDKQDMDRASVGTRSHKIAETLTTRLNVIYGSTGYENAEAYLSKLHDFLTLNILKIKDKAHWLQSLTAIDPDVHFQELHAEISEQIFCGQQDSLSLLLEQESLKRILLRFVKIERHRLQHQKPLRTIAFVEQSITIQLSGIEIKGRIDRIDTDSEGVSHIIDYKSGRRTAKAYGNAHSPKQPPKLVLLPSGSNSILSLQGALYTMAWQERGNAVGSFSLCLLNEDPDSAIVTSHVPEGLRQYYESVALSLSKGQFAPLKNSACPHCIYKQQCPIFVTGHTRTTAQEHADAIDS